MSELKTALITGATSGIGRGVAQRLLAESWQVIAIGRNFTRDRLPSERYLPVVLDLAALDQLPSQLTALARTHAEIDALVLCAGRGRFGSLEEYAYAEIRALVDLNFTSQAYVTRAFLPGMKRRGFGDVVLIGSEAALRGSRKGSIYCASKFALRGFAQALREECGKSGIRVTLVNPGMVATPFFDELDFAPGSTAGQHLVAEDVADAVAMVLQARGGCVFDEINLSPLHHVIRFGAK